MDSSWEANLGNNSGTPSDKLAVVGWPGRHWFPASSFAASFFTDAPWWVAISGYFSNDFSFCQLGTVQGVQLGALSRMDQSKMLASLIWIRLDCVCLALRLAHTLFSSPVGFHPPLFHLPNPHSACYELTRQPSPCLLAPSPQANTMNGRAMGQTSKNNILRLEKLKFKSSPSSATN